MLFVVSNPDQQSQSVCELRGDNQGSLALSVNPVYHQRTKHIDIRHRFICEMVNAGVIRVQYVPSKDMLADGFTKPLPKDTHVNHCERIGLRLHPDKLSDAPPSDASKSLHLPPDSSAHTACMVTTNRRKIRFDDCGNLFRDDAALKKHKLKKEL